jgi:hypothetical protein
MMEAQDMGDEEQKQGPEIALAEMIETLRQELEAAQRKGIERPVAFGVEKVELELKVVLSRQGKVGGGIKFWVVSAEGSGGGARETAHNFKLTLLPLDPETKKRLEIAGKSETPIDKKK